MREIDEVRVRAGAEAEELPELPAGWAWASVGEVYAVVGGGTPSSSRLEYWTGSVPWISSADIDDTGGVNPRRHITDSAIAHSAANLVPAGTIIVATRVGLGKVAVAPCPLCFSQDCQGLVGGSGLAEPRYALHYLSATAKGFRGRGTTIAGITKRQLAEVPMRLLPLNEQRRIVARLDGLLSDFEAGISRLKRALAKLKRYRQAVLKAAVEGELSREWREAHEGQVEPASELLERILKERRTKWEAEQGAKGNKSAKCQDPQTPDASDLPKLPEGWVWASVAQLLSEVMCNGVSVKGSETPTETRALKLSAMTDQAFDYDQFRYLPIPPLEVRHLTIQEGDFFVSRGNGSLHLAGRGTLAQEPPFDVIFPDTMIRLRLNIRESRWLSSIWSSRQIRSQIEKRLKTTAGIWKISQPELSATAVPLPSSEEQTFILQELDRRLSGAGRLATTLAANLTRAGRLRQAILKRAFSGDLVPQDPNDEPASVLLERIRAEREKTPAPKRGRKHVQTRPVEEGSDA